MTRTFGYDPPLALSGKRRFVAYFYLVGFDMIQLGFHICLSLPNIEIHVPFGFFRIGMNRVEVYRG